MILADDQESISVPQRPKCVLRHLPAVLAELDLRLNQKKSRITTFTEGFTLIGHRFIGDRVIKLPKSL